MENDLNVLALRFSEKGLNDLDHFLENLPCDSRNAVLISVDRDFESIAHARINDRLKYLTNYECIIAAEDALIQDKKIYIVFPEMQVLTHDGRMSFVVAASSGSNQDNDQKNTDELRAKEKFLFQNEVWFRNMADGAPVMIWVSDIDMRFTFVNKTWLEYTGLPLQQELNSGWTDSVHKDDIAETLSVFNKAYFDKEEFKKEMRLLREDGEHRWVMNTGKPNFDAAGNFLGFIGTCVETHDMKVMNEQLEQHVKSRTKALADVNLNLERSNHDLEQFAYVASHDLQEPMRKIITFNDRLQNRFKEQMPKDALPYMEKMAASALRMTRLIDDLLNFSRVSRAGESFEETDLNKTLKKVLKDLDDVINKQNARISADDLPVIEAVPGLIQQVFQNLVSNALKFTEEEKHPELSITSSFIRIDKYPQYSDLPDTAYAELIFKDNGIGFNQSFAQQIFVIFQRLNEKHKYPGTGIGLAVCKKIVNYHNGVIFAESEEGNGASFHVLLPLKQVKK